MRPKIFDAPCRVYVENFDEIIQIKKNIYTDSNRACNGPLLQDDLFSEDKDIYEQNKKEEDGKRGKERRNKNNDYAQDYRFI